MDFIPRERHCNMVEAALPPSARDRPVSAVRKKIHYTGRVTIK